MKAGRKTKQKKRNKTKRQDERIREVKTEQTERIWRAGSRAGEKCAPHSPTPQLCLDYGNDAPEHEMHSGCTHAHTHTNIHTRLMKLCKQRQQMHLQ